MMTSRKNQLLIAAAVAALMTGSGFALAQDSSPATKPPSAAPATKAPAEKIAPSTTEKAPSAADKGAQKSEDKSLPSKRSSEKSEDKSLPSKRSSETKPASKSKTETTGQAPTAPSSDKSTTTKSDTTKSDTTKSDTTTTQSPSKTTQDKAGTTTSQPTQSTQSTQPSQPNQATGPGSTQKSGGTAAGTTTNSTTNVSVNLSPEQRTKIHQVIVSDHNAPRLARVDFQLNVGVAVPRSVRLAPIPTTIVEIQPSWRGYEYFLVGDQIVIVNPRTMEIVAVIPA